ncbi:hypothetical protein Cni_G24587 [Canna indica]|uniref:Smr domain-containing protein n=1 Tax=Canna indica TaxID=4628 RepID=A0AAQ3L0E8_9LILI|nr:hypothetical protein Cni_G24587 [Canna indica]
MASSTPPHYSITTPKPHHGPQPTPHKPLQKHHQGRRRSSCRLQSSSSSGPATASSSAGTSSGATSTTISSSASAGSNGASPSATSHKNGILGRKPAFLPYYPQQEAGLAPDFRRSRTTRVVSKRNLSSSKPSQNNHRTASPAAAQCFTQILRSSADNRTLGNILTNFGPDLAIPEDYCYILHELGDRDKYPLKAIRFFHCVMPFMRNPTEQGKLLTAAIGGLGRMGCPDLARQIFDIGIAVGYAKTVFAHSALISAYARSGLAAEAMDTLSMMKAAGLKPTTVSYNALIDACGKGGVDIHLTLGFFREMLHNGLCPDRKTFNSLLAACSRAGHLEDARMVFDEMIHLGIGRDIYTYNTFIDAICKCGNMELALQVMLDMPVNNVQPNVVTYSTLMDGYSKLEQFDEALNLYEKMKALKIGLDRVCYNTLLSIYVKTGRYEEIARVCEEMEVIGVDKDTVTYNCLINGYGKQGRFDVVASLIQEMRDRGVSPSILTYSTLIDIYSKAGMYGDAANVFLGFKESGLKADVVLYSSFIDTLAKNGLIDCAVWLLDEMTRMGIEPNVVTYNTIIDAFGKSGIVVEEDGVGNGVVGAEGSGSQIVGAFGQIGKGIVRPVVEESRRRSEELLCILGLFQKMIQQGVRPNVVTFSAILNACSRCNSFEDASLLLDQLRIFDNFVYGVAHGLLMGSREVWVQARSLFDELKRMDPPTSSAFYNALTDMLWHFGQRRGAQQVVLEGVHRNVWEHAWNENSLDLHLMSVGAAQAMVHTWLLTIHSIVFEGRKLPEFLSILTGWGKHSKVAGASTLRRVIEALLHSIGAPFHLEKFNVGRFVSAGAIVAAWLRESGTKNILLLHDERIQSTSSLNLLPRLQALQL